jgi:hypothetical protein
MIFPVFIIWILNCCTYSVPVFLVCIYMCQQIFWWCRIDNEKEKKKRNVRQVMDNTGARHVGCWMLALVIVSDEEVRSSRVARRLLGWTLPMEWQTSFSWTCRLPIAARTTHVDLQIVTHDAARESDHERRQTHRALCGYQLGGIGTMIHGWNRGHMQTCRTCDGVLLYPDTRHSQNMFFLIHLVTSHDNAK